MMRRAQRTFNAESYRGWRKKIPWTDEELAAACEAESDAIAAESSFLAIRYRILAERARRGYVSGYVLTIALPRLITKCFCGRKALYRCGNEGRCSEHRLVPEKHAMAKRARLESASSVYEADRRAYDYKDLDRETFRKTRKAGDRKS